MKYFQKISATSPLSLKEYFECHFGQSKLPTRNVKSRKDQQQDTRKGKQPGTRESSKKTVGKFTSKTTEPFNKAPVSLNSKSVKEVPETPGKTLKFTVPGMTVSQGKSIPVSKAVNRNVTKMKYALTSDKKVETGFGSHGTDNLVEGDNLASACETVENDNLESAGKMDNNCYDGYYHDSSKDLSKLVANIELVELAGVHFQDECLVPLLNVEFFMPEKT